jgi:hypothetical protein
MRPTIPAGLRVSPGCNADKEPRSINTCVMNAGINFYHQLTRAGACTSLRAYSRDYLGMAENYACLRGERGPSNSALINLFRRLWAERRLILASRVARAILWGGLRHG